jgi:NADH-quinone oxidoreductase subunit L
MLVPEIILAIFASFGGFLGFALGKRPILEEFLKEVDGALPLNGFLLSPEMWTSLAGALLGVGAAVFLFKRYTHMLLRPMPFIKKGFYINEIYDAFIVKPLKALSESIVEFFEPTIFDGFIRMVIQGTRKAAIGLQQFQSGQIRSYVAWMAVGMVLLVAYFIL